MKKIYPMILIVMVCVLVAGVAEAGIFGKVKELMTTQVLAWVITGFLALIGVIWAGFDRMLTTTKESTAFLDALADAIKDKKMTKEELENVIAKGKLVVNAFKKTPIEYQVK